MPVNMRRNDVDAPVPNTRFGNQFVCKSPNFCHGALEKNRLHAVLMSDVRMHLADNQIAVFMLLLSEAHGELSFVMVVDVAHYGHAGRAGRRIGQGLRGFCSAN